MQGQRIAAFQEKTVEKKEEIKTTQVKAMNMDLYIPFVNGHKKDCACDGCKSTREKYRLLRNDIKLCRYALRKVSSVIGMAAMAGSTIKEGKNGDVSVVPAKEPLPGLNEKKATKRRDIALLELATGVEGATPYYSGYYMFKQLLPDWPADVHSCLLRRLNQLWFAKDPNTGCSRDFMYENAMRKVPQCHGVGIPLHPGKNVIIDGHTVTVRVGAGHKLKLGTKDPARWGILKKVLDGTYKIGNPIWINLDHEGKPFIGITYHEPIKALALDQERVLEVAFTDDQNKFMILSLREGHRPTPIDEMRHVDISALGVIDGLARLDMQSQSLKEIRRSCGNRFHGHKGALESVNKRSDRLTRCRDNTVKTWNHRWTAQITGVAESWRCGRILVMGVPSDLLGYSWQWADFKFKFYKASNKGIQVSFTGDVKASEVTELLKKEA